MSEELIAADEKQGGFGQLVLDSTRLLPNVLMQMGILLIAYGVTPTFSAVTPHTLLHE
jgi:hypothetical protein